MGKLESFNPATGELVGSVETIKPDQVQAVVDDVAEVQPFWAQLSLADRSRYLRKAADVLVEEVDDVAQLLTREQGKPITESYTMEVVPTIDVLHWCADNGPKILDDEPVRMGQALFLSKQAKFSYEPLGVVGVIAPWNYPWSIPFDEVAMALMAGNGVVLKPASLTPLLGERIGEICAKHLKGSVLELGGKDPQIVCADADLPNAISGCVWGGFANAGQTCSGIERTYVVKDVADRFLDGVTRRAGELTVGDPTEWETEIGPMVSEDQFGVVTELVDDALSSGADRVAGGPREVPGFSGKFIAPTVLAGVEDEMRIMKE